MKIQSVLYECALIKRYKRFLVDAELKSGEIITVHCPNPGSMKTCFAPGWRGLVSHCIKPGRKLQWTLEFVHNGKCWIGVNTFYANRLVAEGLRAGLCPSLSGFCNLQPEYHLESGSRIDFMLEYPFGQKCFLEVKSVSMVHEGFYSFPDAVTKRGLKHLQELEQLSADGHRAVLLLLVLRSDGHGFRPAAHIDPEWSEAFYRVQKNGVEVLVCPTEIKPPDYTMLSTFESKS